MGKKRAKYVEYWPAVKDNFVHHIATCIAMTLTVVPFK